MLCGLMIGPSANFLISSTTRYRELMRPYSPLFPKWTQVLPPESRSGLTEFGCVIASPDAPGAARTYRRRLAAGALALGPVPAGGVILGLETGWRRRNQEGDPEAAAAALGVAGSAGAWPLVGWAEAGAAGLTEALFSSTR